jgi:pimeloyl-ACP methyl ester carboxylesterase
VTREVILVPGLWNPTGVLWPLAARLRRAGYAPRIFDYRGRGSLDGNVERLAGFVRATLGGRTAHFVGHSLGGVLVLETLNRHADIAVASALLLGSPVRGSFAGRRFGRTRLGRWMLGESASCWEERSARWSRQAPLGVLAGSVAIGLGRVAGGRLPGVNDGVVRLEETVVEGVAASQVVPQPHSWMPVSPRVARMTETFLRTGSFG